MSPDVDGSPVDSPLDAWFRGAGMGLFIHWDHASQQGIEISWSSVGRSVIPGHETAEDQVSRDEYESSAATFDPVLWDARAIASAARDAGAKYIVFTTRHHAGYSMFETDHSKFSVMNSPIGRDLTRELVEATREAGLRVGLYYSLSDWHHPDYPAFTDADRPYPAEHWPAAGWPENASRPVATDRHRRADPARWESYRRYLKAQLTELLTHYGTIDLVWFDGGWERSPDEWGGAEIRQLIRDLQPDAIVNDRLLGHGDYETPEQAFPSQVPDSPWEMCLTIGESWSWRPSDTNIKSARSILVSLVEVVSRGGNMLLNVSPRGDGTLPPVQIDRLTRVGEWMSVHGPSVHNVFPATGVQFYGPVTRTDSSIFLHLVQRPVEEIIVRGVTTGKIREIRVMNGGKSLSYRVVTEVHENVEGIDHERGEIRITAPAPSDAIFDVIEIVL